MIMSNMTKHSVAYGNSIYTLVFRIIFNENEHLYGYILAITNFNMKTIYEDHL